MSFENRYLKSADLKIDQGCLLCAAGCGLAALGAGRSDGDFRHGALW